MKIAIVHDWLTGMRGGEKCLEVFCGLFPHADLFTLLHIPDKVSPLIESMSIHTSFLQHLPFVKTQYRYYLPLMPLAIEQLDLRGYDLVLSSSHCVAKGVRLDPHALHICYCYTPMRYIWDQYDQYFKTGATFKPSSVVMGMLVSWLRRWDVRSSKRVHRFIAISRHVQQRIKDYYQCDSEVIYPPVNTRFYAPAGESREDYFLIVSAFAPYKRLDLAIEAFNKLGYPLKIVGEGQDSHLLRKIAGPNVRFLGRLSDKEIRSCYERCRAFIFPGEEDFGITPLEAQSMGRPVIAFARGGALETVVPDRESWTPETGIPEELTLRPSGVFFYNQTPDDLCAAIQHFIFIESRFDPASIRAHAVQFDQDIFIDRMRRFMSEQIQNLRC